MIRHLRAWEERCISFVEQHLPWCATILHTYRRLIRYLIAGTTAAVVDLFLLYFFTDILSIHYLISASLAFLVAFVVSFALQKFWTFQDPSTEKIHSQAALYFVVASLNLALNGLLMYLFVEKLNIWYMFAQVLASGLIAFESFFVSRYVIFNRGERTTPLV